MEKGFKKIFWGFIFLSFHINLGSFQILPDCISYFIILTGVDLLFENYNSRSFKRCLSLLWILIITGFIEDCSRTLGTPILQGYSYGFIYSAVMCIVNLLMVYFLFEGIIELLQGYNYENEAISFAAKQKYYIIADTFLSMLIIGLGGLGNNSAVVILAVVIGMAIKIWLIININYLTKINFTKTDLEI